MKSGVLVTWLSITNASAVFGAGQPIGAEYDRTAWRGPASNMARRQLKRFSGLANEVMATVGNALADCFNK